MGRRAEDIQPQPLRRPRDPLANAQVAYLALREPLEALLLDHPDTILSVSRDGTIRRTVWKYEVRSWKYEVAWCSLSFVLRTLSSCLPGLPGLAADLLAGVADALALVGLGLAD